MNIAFCINDAYVPYVTVTIKSILVNHPDSDISFYIILDDISEKNRNLLDEVTGREPLVHCYIIVVDSHKIAGLRRGNIHESIWYRILLPELLPLEVNRVLYLDADTLVMGSIKELFSIDMENTAVAGCWDPLSFYEETFERLGYEPKLGYICAGVLLVNLNYWRKYNLVDEIIRYAKKNEAIIKMKDQDSINYVCRNRKYILHLKYAVMDCFLTKYKSAGWFSISELKDCLKEPRIVHFAGNAPWKIEYAHRLFHDDWQKYNMMLKHPVKMKYETKVIPLLKMFLWNLLHRKQEPAVITKEEVLNQLSLLNN